MSFTSVLVIALVVYGAMSAYVDLVSFVRSLRAANEEITNVIAFEERQRGRSVRPPQGASPSAGRHASVEPRGTRGRLRPR